MSANLPLNMKIPTGGGHLTSHYPNAKLPSFKLLSGFEATARLSSYSRAAEELCISQSAVSHQIAQLEEFIGEPLFHRVGRGITLTVSGILLYESVVNSLEAIRTGLGRIETYLNPNTICMVCPAQIAHGWLQQHLQNMQIDIPDMCPIISTDETARFVDELDVDLAISKGSLHQEGTTERLLLKDQIIIVGTRDIERKLRLIPPDKHAEKVAMMYLENDLITEKIDKYIREHFSSFRKAALYDDPRLLIDAAKRGMGLAAVSSLAVNENIENGTLVPIPNYPMLDTDQYYLTRLDQEPRITHIETVWRFLLTASRQNSLNKSNIPTT